MLDDPVTLAQQLLDLVKSIYEPAPGGPKVERDGSFDEWNARIKIQTVCDQLLAQVMGPSEYAILVAGAQAVLINIALVTIFIISF